MEEQAARASVAPCRSGGATTGGRAGGAWPRRGGRVLLCSGLPGPCGPRGDVGRPPPPRPAETVGWRGSPARCEGPEPAPWGFVRRPASATSSAPASPPQADSVPGELRAPAAARRAAPALPGTLGAAPLPGARFALAAAPAPLCPCPVRGFPRVASVPGVRERAAQRLRTSSLPASSPVEAAKLSDSISPIVCTSIPSFLLVQKRPLDSQRQRQIGRNSDRKLRALRFQPDGPRGRDRGSRGPWPPGRPLSAPPPGRGPCACIQVQHRTWWRCLSP